LTAPAAPAFPDNNKIALAHDGTAPAPAPAADVRIAVREDKPAILRLLESAHAELRPLSIDVDRVTEALASAFDRNGGLLVAVIGPTDDIRAMIFFRINQPWFSTDYVLEQLCRIVRADCPGLIQTLDQFSDKCRNALGLPISKSKISKPRVRVRAPTLHYEGTQP
jgi:hypothetical protein